MAYSNVSYTSTGGQTYNVPFPYLDADHVKVYLNGVATSAFTWSDAATIHLNDAPAVGATILVRRETPRDGMDKSFSAQPRLKGTDLDEALLQAYYVGLEAIDAADPAALQSYVDAAGVAAGEAEQAVLDAEAQVLLAEAAGAAQVLLAQAEVSLAEDAKDAAVVAQGAAILAQGAAETAQGLAEDAADLAASYAVSAGAGTYQEVPSAPTTDANEVKLYAKDVTGVTELFIRKESNGSEIQVTSGNILNGTPPDASEGTKGIAEIATQAETNAGTDDTRIITPKKLLATPMIYRKNIIINGDMRIAQRGTSFAMTAGSVYCLDRWLSAGASDAAMTFSQDSSTAASIGHRYCLKVDVTTADASIEASQYHSISTRIEGHDIAKAAYGGKTLTLSFWVRSPKTGTHCVLFGNSVADRSYIATYTVNSADTWEYKTVSVTLNYSGGTWNYTNGIGLIVSFILACGSTFHNSAGSWLTGTYLATSAQVNCLDNTANDFFLTGVQLEVGDAATEFDERDYGTELALCQRYFYTHIGGDLHPTTVGMADSATDGFCAVPFPTTMRVTPTLSFSAASDFYTRPAGGANNACTNLALTSTSSPAVGMVVPTVASGLTVGHGIFIRAANTNARMYFNAEI